MAIKQNQNIFNSRRGHVVFSPNYERFFNYLRQSPTYRLACIALSGDKKAKAAGAAIPDFLQVLNTAKEFGDVWSANFETWWLDTGLLKFGERGDKPQPRVLLETGIEQAGVQHGLFAAFEKFYGKHGRVDHASFFVEIPKSLTRAEMIAFVIELHSTVADELRAGCHVKPAPRHAFLVNKINSSTLDAGHKFLELYQSTDLEMWRIAEKIGLSTKHKGAVDADAPNVRFDHNDVKIKLSIAAHKLKSKAILLAENAARGRFPCVDKFSFELPVYRVSKRKSQNQE
jgi:hypothetical protein